ncbi:MAG: SDR family NAD(P)-dependent oxidoreductase [Burkholderiales bacterium]|nr:SDR family NAD(P)-dependent oxidoreductase [Burkholderiales bacterium]
MNLAIVTGTTSGIGAALRDALSVDANYLVVTLSRAPGTTSPANVALDVADLAAMEPAFDEVLRHIGGAHFEHAVLINNAGVVSPVGAFDEIGALDTGRNLIVNVAAPMALTRLFALATRNIARQRLVVNISSGAAKRAIAGWSAYCTAKAALEMATRVAALEAAATDPTLAICSLAPGVVDTPMQGFIRSVDEKQFPDVARFRTMKAEGALRDAHDVARDIVALIAGRRLTNGGNFDIRELT